MRDTALDDTGYTKRTSDQAPSRKIKNSNHSEDLTPPEYSNSDSEITWPEDNKMSSFNILATCAAKELKLIMKKRGHLDKENIDYTESNSSEFEDELNMSFPIVVVGGKKVFKCTFPGCAKVFPSLSRMRRHYIIHTGVKPFKCLNAKCHKSFSRRDNMIQHYKGHCVHTKPNSSTK